MTAEEQNNVQDEGITSETPSDGEVFTEKAPEQELKSDIKKSGVGIHQELSEYDLFAGDEDFYSLLEESSGRKAVEQPIGEPSYTSIESV